MARSTKSTPTPPLRFDLITLGYELFAPPNMHGDRSFFGQLIQRAAPPYLEAGCGGGRLLRYYLIQGHDVRGFDSSAHALRILCTQASAEHLKPRIWQATFADSSEPKPPREGYGLAMIPAASLCLAGDVTAATAALKNLHGRLQNEGLLAASVYIPPDPDTATPTRWQYRGARDLPDWTGARPGERLRFCERVVEHDEARQLHVTELRVERVDAGRNVLETAVETQRYHWFEPGELLDMATRAGFSEAHVFSGHSFEPLAEDDALFSLVALK